ncbi:hypothetical protein RYH73_06170 [Olivibacter sp. CPCC 100613]|uniref:hypothetical protein n=1 Tax=Olivibacter sp. CPCC 100613 TaxID=3079931 RepID=UPI002FF9683E
MYRIRKLITLFWYKLFTKKLGSRAVIYRPFKFSFKYIEVGNNFYLGPHARLEAITRYNAAVFRPCVLIGDQVSIEQGLHLTCAGSIEIGSGSALAAYVSITDIAHGHEDISLPPEKQDIQVSPVRIGQNCKIYNNVVILPGVMLGKHTIVGSNSVVRKGTYPDYCILVGSPAYIVKRYCFERKGWFKTNKKGEFLST